MSDTKRGQLSFFLILIIGMLLLTSLVVFMLQEPLSLATQPTTQTNKNTNTQLIADSLSSCIDDQINIALLLFGSQGGVVRGTASATDLVLPIETYLKRSTVVIPSVSTLEERFSAVVENIVSSCVDKDYLPGFDIEQQGIVKASTIFTEQVTAVKIEYPIVIKGSGLAHPISRFDYTYPVRIAHYVDIAEKIIADSLVYPDWFDALYLGSFDVGVSVEPITDQTFVVTVQDRLRDDAVSGYEFKFSMIKDPTPPPNSDPGLLKLNAQYTLSTEQSRIVDVNAVDVDGDELYYSIDNEDTFSIDSSNGLLTRLPTTGKGTYTVTITVNDGKGGWDEEQVQVMVT